MLWIQAMKVSTKKYPNCLGMVDLSVLFLARDDNLLYLKNSVRSFFDVYTEEMVSPKINCEIFIMPYPIGTCPLSLIGLQRILESG
jgi:hypothetical protein